MEKRLVNKVETIINAKNSQDAIAQIRKLRLVNKDRWLFLHVNLEEESKHFFVKSFNLSIQIIRDSVTQVRHSDGLDLTAKKFNECLLSAFSYK